MTVFFENLVHLDTYNSSIQFNNLAQSWAEHKYADECWVSFVLIGPYWLSETHRPHKILFCSISFENLSDLKELQDLKDIKDLQNLYGHPESFQFFGPSGPLWLFGYFLTSNLNITDKTRLSLTFFACQPNNFIHHL